VKHKPTRHFLCQGLFFENSREYINTNPHLKAEWQVVRTAKIVAAGYTPVITDYC
jgi:hypothetical protein